MSRWQGDREKRGGRSHQFVCVLRLCSLVVGTCESLNKLLYKYSLFEGKIFGPTEEANGIWRIKTNKDLDELIKHRYIANLLFDNFWYFADRASLYIYRNIQQIDALNFIMSLFHASTCFGHMCSSSVCQKCTIPALVSPNIYVAARCTDWERTAVLS